MKKVKGTTNVISISDTTIKAMAVADNCTCGWGTRTTKTGIILSIDS